MARTVSLLPFSTSKLLVSFPWPLVPFLSSSPLNCHCLSWTSSWGTGVAGGFPALLDVAILFVCGGKI